MSEKLFQGEIMTCDQCGWTFKSISDLESEWTALELPEENKVIYICPSCFGIPRWRWPKTVKEAWDKDHGQDIKRKLLNFGEVVKIIKVGHPMFGRVGSVAAPIEHAQAIKLKPNEYWIELISNDGDKFYGRYNREDLELFYA